MEVKYHFGWKIVIGYCARELTEMVQDLIFYRSIDGEGIPSEINRQTDSGKEGTLSKNLRLHRPGFRDYPS